MCVHLSIFQYLNYFLSNLQWCLNQRLAFNFHPYSESKAPGGLLSRIPVKDFEGKIWSTPYKWLFEVQSSSLALWQMNKSLELILLLFVESHNSWLPQKIKIQWNIGQQNKIKQDLLISVWNPTPKQSCSWKFLIDASGDWDSNCSAENLLLIGWNPEYWLLIGRIGEYGGKRHYSQL